MNGSDFIGLLEQWPVYVHRFRRNPDGTYALDYATDDYYDLLGIAHVDPVTDIQAAIAKTIREDRSNLINSIDESAAALTPWNYDFRIRGKDGENIWLHGESIPRAHVDGCIVWNGFIQNITESKKASFAFKEEHARADSIINLSYDAIITIDNDYRIIQWNRGAETIFGYAAADTIGKPLDFILPPKMKGNHVKFLKEFHNSEGQSRLMGRRPKIEGIRRNGERFPAEASITKYRLADRDYMTVILRDQTEQHANVAALETQQKHLTEAEQIAHLGHWQWNIATGGLEWSDEIYRIFGHEPGAIEPTYENFLLAIHPEDRKSVEDAVAEVLKGATYDIIHRVVRPDQQIVIVRERGIVHYDENGKAVSMTGLVQDITEQQATQDMLLAAMAHKEALLQAIPDVYLVLHREGRIVSIHANDDGSPLTAPLDGIQSPTINDLPLSGEDRDEIKKSIRHLLTHGGLVTLEHDVKVSGGDKSSEVRMTNLDSENVIALIRDITERKLAEKEITARSHDLAILHNLDELILSGAGPQELAVAFSESLLDHFDCFGAGVYFLTPDGSEIVLQNVGLAHTIHVKLEKLLGVEIKDGRFRVKKIKIFRRLIESRESVYLNDPHEVKDLIKEMLLAWNNAIGWKGRVLTALLGNVLKILDSPNILIIPLRSEDGLLGVVQIATANNLTVEEQDRIIHASSHLSSLVMRSRAETALHEQAQILQQVHDAIIVSDVDRRITFWNQGARELFGYETDEVLGMKTNFLIADNDSYIEVEAVKRKALQEGQATVEWRMKKKSGDTFIGRVTIKPYKSPSGQELGIIRTIADVTHQRNLAEEQLRSQKLESLGIFAGGLAHDFNNFLTNVLLNVNIARLQLRDNPEVDDQLISVEHAVDRIKGVTKQLLTFSRGGEPVMTSLHLPPMVKEATMFSLRGSAVSPTFDMPIDLPPVNGDLDQLAQVISNLCLNAIQAMKKGGKLYVRGTEIDISTEDINIPLEAGKYIRLAIEDEGAGIPIEHLYTIFDPYFTTKKTGSGLGLASSFAIIQKHGGWIIASNRKQGGACFTIYLPVSTESPSETNQIADMAGGSGRILVMDDDKDIRMGIARLLNKFGYEVITCNDGESAITVFNEADIDGKPFDLVILDLTIKEGMGGLETISILRKDKPEIKAIVCSGYSNDPVISNPGDYGFAGVLAKPFSLTTLKAVINDVLLPDM